MPIPIRPSGDSIPPIDPSKLTKPAKDAAKTLAMDTMLNVANKAGQVAKTAERLQEKLFEKAGKLHRDVHPPGT